VVESRLIWYSAAMLNRVVPAATLFATAALLAGAFAPAARAQMGGPMDPSQMLKNGAAQAAPNQPKAQGLQPPALPGAASRSDAVAPATRIPTDMSPNDALFDAINRGDVAAARDALNRGAELEARSVLGMTPLELSVDLGRNDISFLLLSYRGSDSGSSGGPPPTQAASAKGAPAGGNASAATKAARRPVMPVKAELPVAPRTPRLFANDGGTPVPSAGFLGFDAGQR
jgi:hypothetical protein